MSKYVSEILVGIIWFICGINAEWEVYTCPPDQTHSCITDTINQKITFTCNSGATCNLSCTDQEGCKESTFYIRDGATFNFICTGENTCDNVIIDCETGTVCDLRCSNLACTGARMWCNPENCSTNKGTVHIDTNVYSLVPSIFSSIAPSIAPNIAPSIAPTISPIISSSVSSLNPSITPTIVQTKSPSISFTIPTMNGQTLYPTWIPTISSSVNPSKTPTENPSVFSKKNITSLADIDYVETKSSTYIAWIFTGIILLCCSVTCGVFIYYVYYAKREKPIIVRVSNNKKAKQKNSLNEAANIALPASIQTPSNHITPSSNMDSMYDHRLVVQTKIKTNGNVKTGEDTPKMLSPNMNINEGIISLKNGNYINNDIILEYNESDSGTDIEIITNDVNTV